MMKIIKLQPMITKDGKNFKPSLRKPIYVKEKNRFFKWYKDNSFFKVMGEFEK